MSEGVKLIAEERQRQIDKEGWTTDHDDQHRDGSLVMAACAYAAHANLTILKVIGFDRLYNSVYSDIWPWDKKWDKRKKHKDPIKKLTIAGALIAAEIDRLRRLESRDD